MGKRERHAMHVIGTDTVQGVAAAVHGVKAMERNPAFFRWVRKPRVGRPVLPTVSTETIVWGVDLQAARRDALESAAEWARENIRVEVVPADAVRGRAARAQFAAHHARMAAASVVRGRRMYR